MITAAEARHNVDLRKNPYFIWVWLNDKIEQTSKNGVSCFTFKTNVSFNFHEDRKTVKSKLEALGYSVTYRKYCDNEAEGDVGNYWIICW